MRRPSNELSSKCPGFPSNSFSNPHRMTPLSPSSKCLLFLSPFSPLPQINWASSATHALSSAGNSSHCLSSLCYSSPCRCKAAGTPSSCLHHMLFPQLLLMFLLLFIYLGAQIGFGHPLLQPSYVLQSWPSDLPVPFMQPFSIDVQVPHKLKVAKANWAHAAFVSESSHLEQNPRLLSLTCLGPIAIRVM